MYYYFCPTSVLIECNVTVAVLIFLVSTSSFIVNITWIFSWARVGYDSPDRTFVRLYLFNASLGLDNGICFGPKLGVDAVNAF